MSGCANTSIDQLLQRPDIWRNRALASARPPGLATGFDALDRILTWDGWPTAALTEILVQGGSNIGTSFALICPTLARLSADTRWLVAIDPPFVPYAPPLAAAGIDLARLAVVNAEREAPWAAEQALRSGVCSIVLCWGWSASHAALRRIQIAAQTGGAMAVLFRDMRASQEHSPASLRLAVQPLESGTVQATILKQRGGAAGARVSLHPFAHAQQPRASIEPEAHPPASDG